jgi:hypothetical protein
MEYLANACLVLCLYITLRHTGVSAKRMNLLMVVRLEELLFSHAIACPEGYTLKSSINVFVDADSDVPSYRRPLVIDVLCQA